MDARAKPRDPATLGWIADDAAESRRALARTTTGVAAVVVAAAGGAGAYYGGLVPAAVFDAGGLEIVDAARRAAAVVVAHARALELPAVALACRGAVVLVLRRIVALLPERWRPAADVVAEALDAVEESTPRSFLD